MGASPHLWFLHAKQRTFGSELQVSVSQTSPLDFCKKNKVISIRNTSLYGSQPSFVVFAIKTATLGPELQVSMGPRLRLLICA